MCRSYLRKVGEHDAQLFKKHQPAAARLIRLQSVGGGEESAMRFRSGDGATGV
jgi:hypothetical protein